ncbi:MAG: hypothetical protein OXR67_17595 [Chloroflexota bacterium]|nr:hypothetical protein [Chloroflexota bacterium]
MYLIALSINLISRFGRARLQPATEGERRMLQEHIDLSQSIHDTVVQAPYIIGLGIDGVVRLAGDSNTWLVERLNATAELSKSATWELRRSIDTGILGPRDAA